MKRKEWLLIGVLCFGLVMILGLVGCGKDDECRDGCNKIFSCLEQIGLDPTKFGGSVDGCTDFCVDENTVEMRCAINCNRDLNCIEYGTCVAACGI